MEKEEDTKVYVPQPVAPPPADLRPPPPLEGKQEEQRLQVLSHFSDENYELPGVEKDPSLTEVEKFWLVSRTLPRHGLPGPDSLKRQTTVF